MTGNARKIILAARSAYARGVRLLITPELAICGYAAEDLFLRPSFIEACHQAVSQVQQELADLKEVVKKLRALIDTPNAYEVASGILDTMKGYIA